MKIALWILGALAGVVLAAGVTYAASSLSTQRIGLSSEPVNAGRELAPRATATRAPTATPSPKPTPRTKKRRPKPTVTPRATTTQEAAAAAATTPRTIDWKRRRSSAMISVPLTEI